MVETIAMKLLNNILVEFSSCFSRKAAFHWFVVIIIGLMIRTDTLGLTSIIRDLNLDGNLYPAMNHFFYSKAWCLENLRNKWILIVKNFAPLIKVDDRFILPADGVKKSKEGRYMPGVKKMVNESENSATPSYMYGHMFGSVGVIAGNIKKKFCIPLWTELHDGVSKAFEWDNNQDRTHSHIVQTIIICYKTAMKLGKSIGLLDRYFMSVPALKMLDFLNKTQGEILHIITRAKRSYVAFEKPPPPTGKRGAPPKKGKKKYTLGKVFEDKADKFETIYVNYYGKQRDIKAYRMELVWGRTLYKVLCFVFVDVDGSKTILASTDLTLSTKQIIEQYCLRFKIEAAFRELKQVIAGFGHRFWMKNLPKLNRRRKKDEPDEFEQIDNDRDRRTFINKIRATEMYSLCSNIALGLLQILAIQIGESLDVKKIRFLRTYSNSIPSEATMAAYIRQQLYFIFSTYRNLPIVRIIKSKQRPP